MFFLNNLKNERKTRSFNEPEARFVVKKSYLCTHEEVRKWCFQPSNQNRPENSTDTLLANIKPHIRRNNNEKVAITIIDVYWG